KRILPLPDSSHTARFLHPLRDSPAPRFPVTSGSTDRERQTRRKPGTQSEGPKPGFLAGSPDYRSRSYSLRIEAATLPERGAAQSHRPNLTRRGEHGGWATVALQLVSVPFFLWRFRSKDRN